MNLPFTTRRAERGQVLNILSTMLTSASALMIITMQLVPPTTVYVAALGIQNKHEIHYRFAAQLSHIHTEAIIICHSALNTLHGQAYTHTTFQSTCEAQKIKKKEKGQQLHAVL